MTVIPSNSPIEGQHVAPHYANTTFNVNPIDPTNSTLIILGPSGGGKDFRARHIADKYNLTYTGSGEMYREMGKLITPEQKMLIAALEARKGVTQDTIETIVHDNKAIVQMYSDAGISHLTEHQMIATYRMDKGYFVPDDITKVMTRDKLKALHNDRQRPFVLDGYVRTQQQVYDIAEISEELGVTIAGSLLVETPLDLLQQRTLGRLHCKPCDLAYNTEVEGQQPNNISYKNDVPSGDCTQCTHPLTRRADDEPHKILNRLETYRREISSVLDALKEIGLETNIVSGNINPYSEALVKKSVDNALACNNDCVRKYLNSAA